jgi:hypothetical protein
MFSTRVSKKSSIQVTAQQMFDPWIDRRIVTVSCKEIEAHGFRTNENVHENHIIATIPFMEGALESSGRKHSLTGVHLPTGALRDCPLTGDKQYYTLTNTAACQYINIGLYRDTACTKPFYFAKDCSPVLFVLKFCLKTYMFNCS